MNKFIFQIFLSNILFISSIFSQPLVQHNGALNNPIYNHNNIVLDSIDQRENKTGFRHYIKN